MTLVPCSRSLGKRATWANNYLDFQRNIQERVKRIGDCFAVWTFHWKILQHYLLSKQSKQNIKITTKQNRNYTVHNTDEKFRLIPYLWTLGTRQKPDEWKSLLLFACRICQKGKYEEVHQLLGYDIVICSCQVDGLLFYSLMNPIQPFVNLSF